MISESGLWWFVRIATIIPKREHKEVRSTEMITGYGWTMQEITETKI